MDKEKFRELCLLYFLNSLGADYTDSFRKALNQQDKKYKNLYTHYLKLFISLPLSIEQVQPDERIKDELLKKIRMVKA